MTFKYNILIKLSKLHYTHEYNIKYCATLISLTIVCWNESKISFSFGSNSVMSLLDVYI